jgi:ketosteroid isomerase-like protein
MLESQDLEGSLALYTKDATFTNPDGTHVSGAVLRDLYKAVFGSFHAKILMTPRSHASSGSLAYEAGSYDEDLRRVGNGDERHVSGNYLTVYRLAESGTCR